MKKTRKKSRKKSLPMQKEFESLTGADEIYRITYQKLAARGTPITQENFLISLGTSPEALRHNPEEASWLPAAFWDLPEDET